MIHATRHIRSALRKSSPILLQAKRAFSHHRPPLSSDDWPLLALGAFTVTASILTHAMTPTQCEAITLDSLPTAADEDIDSKLPTYTSAQVALRDGEKDGAVWMSYGGYVYDVTDFVANHPGGSEKILLAAGGAIEPHWHCELYECVKIHVICIAILTLISFQCTDNTLLLSCLYA